MKCEEALSPRLDGPCNAKTVPYKSWICYMINGCYYSIGEESEVFKPYQFKMDEIEGFRYRAQVSSIPYHTKI